jgi:hypothetical protein
MKAFILICLSLIWASLCWAKQADCNAPILRLTEGSAQTRVPVTGIRNQVPNYKSLQEVRVFTLENGEQVRRPNLSIQTSLFGHGNSIHYRPHDATKDLSDKSNLRIMNLNVKKLQQNVEITRFDEFTDQMVTTTKGKPMREMKGIGNLIKKEKPDIVVFQEVESLTALKDFLKINKLENSYMPLMLLGNSHSQKHIAFLVPKDLKLKFALHSFSEFEDNVFNRDFPVLVVKHIDASVDDDMMLAIGGTHAKSQFSYSSTSSGALKRRKQGEAKAKISKIVRSFYGKDRPFLIAGDFNKSSADNLSPLDAREYRALKELGHQDTLDIVKYPLDERYTYTFKGERAQIDAITSLYKKNKKLILNSWIHHFGSTPASDHEALFVDINVEELLQ